MMKSPFLLVKYGAIMLSLPLRTSPAQHQRLYCKAEAHRAHRQKGKDTLTRWSIRQQWQSNHHILVAFHLELRRDHKISRMALQNHNKSNINHMYSTHRFTISGGFCVGNSFSSRQIQALHDSN